MERDKWCALVCIGVCVCVCVCLLSDNDICFSIVAITFNEIALLCMRASVKQFDTQHLKWCDLVNLCVV
jgi:hypothetical protein